MTELTETRSRFVIYIESRAGIVAVTAVAFG